MTDSGKVYDNQRVRERLKEQVSKDILLGKSKNEIFDKINIYNTDEGARKKVDQLDPAEKERINQIYQEGLAKARKYNKVKEDTTVNLNVEEQKLKELTNQAIKKIESGNDPNDVIEDYDLKLEKIKLPDNKIKYYVQKLFNFIGLDSFKKTKDETEDVLLDEENDKFLPLPKIDTDYDNLKYLQLKEDNKEDLIPPSSKSNTLNTDIINKAEEYNFAKNREEKEKISESVLNETGRLVLGTETLEDFIRQVKLCVMFLPLGVSKAAFEDEIVKVLEKITEPFEYIYIFGWETQLNKIFYKNFEDILKINNEVEGALFIIRDLQTFNVYAANVMKNNPKNYYMVLAESNVEKEDLRVIENLSTSNVFLWPSFIDLKINIELKKNISYIYGEQAEEYNSIIKQNLNKAKVGMKEIHTSLDFSNNKLLYLEARKILNSSFRIKGSVRESFSSSNFPLDTALQNSPKFRNVMIDLFSSFSENSRILVRCPEGKHGIEALLYILEKFGKINIKPVIIRRKEEFLGKKFKIKGIPNEGSCLVITDFFLSDTLTPNNIDKYCIVGGGDFQDTTTILDLCKGQNYTRNIYPRSLEVVNYISKLEGPVKTVDEIDLEKFTSAINKYLDNISTFRDMCISVIIGASEKLYVRKNDF